jgi:TfoX/Sxy family transcriptional regulator of competence genes
MSSRKDTVDFLLEQLSGIDDVRAKRMFGEFGLYVGDQFVAVVCDDDLFVKPTPGGRKFFPDVVERPPFARAKPWLLVPGERWEEAQWLARLFVITARELQGVQKGKRAQRILPGRS